ncbi:Clavaminate synthase-like protein [Dissoconium aciculare CBS 342.82]|uniref:Clavaminate synthase-like protein n=1 Tax=Dissoconium aciculare CBS 342.82 TaxID=1314786 RepID=A0A6J3MH52_9PEZI|nr:Clavaminate synthase-like protein [Dissoconium aciculare CBS 342.82]KAF1827024.1 Clavaminate synthase-like protein [Dissoconium aciculare CBS 342.82]
MAEPIHHRPQQPLTPLLTARLPLLLDFHAACRALCSAVLEHLATALGIPADWFASRHDPDGGPSGSVLRMLYYPGARGPPADDDDDEARGDIRAGAHSDFGSITCLFQLPGQPGLEILTPEGEWAAVAVDPDPLAPSASSPPSESPSPSELSAAAAPSPSSTTATTAAATAPRGRRNLPILVNIGDLLEEWTGGLLKSTRHRVVFPSPAPSPSSSHPGEASGSSSSDRYSLAYFCHPLDDAALEPVPSRLVQEHIASSSRTEAATTTATTTTAKRAVITAKDHLARRLAETYTIPTASP